MGGAEKDRSGAFLYRQYTRYVAGGVPARAGQFTPGCRIPRDTCVFLRPPECAVYTEAARHGRSRFTSTDAENTARNPRSAGTAGKDFYAF